MIEDLLDLREAVWGADNLDCLAYVGSIITNICIISRVKREVEDAGDKLNVARSCCGGCSKEWASIREVRAESA